MFILRNWVDRSIEIDFKNLLDCILKYILWKLGDGRRFFKRIVFIFVYLYIIEMRIIGILFYIFFVLGMII